MTGVLPPPALRGWRWLAVAVALAALGLGTGWAVVFLPPAICMALLGAAFAATLWLQAPTLALYGLAAICPYALSYSVGSISDVRIQDVLLLALAIPAFTTLASGSPRRARLKTPMAKVLLGLWAFLLAWGSLTFILGPVNQWLLKDVVHNAWYVYHDIGRSLVMFPLALICLEDRKSVDRVLDVLILTAAVVALNAIWLARGSGSNATGHFGTTNALAGFLILLIPFVVARILMDDRRRVRIAHVLLLLPMLRALWLAGSRGGLVAFLASMMVLALFVPRRKAVAAGAVGVVGLLLLVAVRGDLLDLPMMQRFIVLRDVKDVNTFQWREQQWEIFLQRIRQRPLLGMGSDVDESLRELDRARTAHNAFLAVSVKSGIPAAVAWGLVLLSMIGLVLRRLLVSVDPRRKVFWMGSLSFLVALVVHNLVESTLILVVTQHIFWLVAASALLLVSPDRSMAGYRATEAPAPAALRI